MNVTLKLNDKDLVDYYMDLCEDFVSESGMDPNSLSRYARGDTVLRRTAINFVKDNERAILDAFRDKLINELYPTDFPSATEVIDMLGLRSSNKKRAFRYRRRR